MKIPLSQLRNSLLSKAGGRAQANIPNFYSLLQETAWTMMAQADLPSSIRIEPFVNPLIDTTGTIVLPDDFNLDGLIAVRPQNTTQMTPYAISIGTNEWNAEQAFYTNSMANQNGVQMLQSRLPLVPARSITELEDLTNGTWTGLGATTNIAIDSQYFISGSSSLSFLAGAGPVNGIVNSSLTAVDVSDCENVLMWIDVPSLQSSIRVSAGSSGADYYYQTVTSNYFNQPLNAGWNLVRLNFTTASVLGTPDLTSLTYIKIEPLDTLASPATFRIDGIVATEDAFVNLEYYSNTIFMNAAGQRIYIPTQDTDFIILSEQEYVLFLRQWGEIANTDVRPTGASVALQVNGLGRLDAMYETFRQKFPSRRALKADDYSSGQSGGFFAPFAPMN